MKRLWFALVVMMLGVATNTYAGDLDTYAFPQKGQTADQQKQDEGFCTQWAQEQTGLDLTLLKYKQEEATKAQQQAEQQSSNSRGRPLLRTAATGAALGGIENNMDDGAGKGAVKGVTVAASRSRTRAAEQKTQGAVNAANTQASSVQADSEKYTKAYSACMEGKGYSIR